MRADLDDRSIPSHRAEWTSNRPPERRMDWRSTAGLGRALSEETSLLASARVRPDQRTEIGSPLLTNVEEEPRVTQYRDYPPREGPGDLLRSATARRACVVFARQNQNADPDPFSSVAARTPGAKRPSLKGGVPRGDGEASPSLQADWRWNDNSRFFATKRRGRPSSFGAVVGSDGYGAEGG